MLKPSTKDKIDGNVHEIKGAAKESVGKITKNDELVEKGKKEKVAGKVQNIVGDLKKVVGE
jgi:uncharacterized protein YjbJ (UPF0337 family)